MACDRLRMRRLGAGVEDDRHARALRSATGSVPVSSTTIRYSGECSIEMPASRDANSLRDRVGRRDALLLGPQAAQRLERRDSGTAQHIGRVVGKRLAQCRSLRRGLCDAASSHDKGKPSRKGQNDAPGSCRRHKHLRPHSSDRRTIPVASGRPRRGGEACPARARHRGAFLRSLPEREAAGRVHLPAVRPAAVPWRHQVRERNRVGRASPSRSPKDTSRPSATRATAWSGPRSSAPAAGRTRATSFPTGRRRPESAIASIRSASSSRLSGEPLARQARTRRTGRRARERIDQPSAG